MKKKLAYLLLFVSMTIQGQTIYYVSTTGNDASGTGTSSNPWKTLYKACNSVTTSGSIIHVNAGTYLENTRCILAPGISIEGEGNSTIITNTSLTSRINYGPNGSNGDAIINMVSSSVSNGNQEIRNLKFDGSGLTSSHALYIMNRNNVKIHNCTFVDFNYCAVVWWASGTGDGVAPPTRLSGSEFYSNNVTNCAGYNQPDGSFYGALYCGGHTGMLIHDNIMIENAHSVGNQGWPIKFWLWGGMMLNCKIYNNYLEKTDFSVWDFVIESTGEDGMEIYNNTMIGGIDLNKQNYSGVYPWSVYIHDNLIGPSTEISALSVSGITLEWNNSHVLIERNIIQNCSPGILFTPRATAQTEVIIRYNILKNIKTSSYYTEGITMNPLGTGTTIDGLYIYNNVIEGTANSTDYGIRLVHAGGSAIASATNVKIINNIILNFNGYNGSYLYLTGAGTFSNLSVQNNLLYNNGNSNNALITGTPASYTNSGNKIGNPLFVGGSPYSYQIQSGSPAKDAGLDIGLTSDYLNNVVPYNVTPDIGAYEFGALGVPGYISSAIENTAPAVLEMTYNLNLANIVPDPSSFTVMVNSVNRTVSSVTINATKVLLTLSSPVINGDVVTVAYNKPATNPLQTPSGGQAPALTTSVVVNRVNPIIPVYVSSAIQNATPTLLEVTYNLTLANITPATSSFVVMVNSISRTVNSVMISGTLVRLTLASAVSSGDVVTVSYTKPALNPLQTSNGGQADNFSAKSVTNNVNAAIPSFVSAVIENITPSLLAMTYSLTLANITPATSAFTVTVNSAARTVNSVVINGNKIQLTLASAVIFGDNVTVAYNKPTTNPLQTSSGGQAANLGSTAVTNNVSPSSPIFLGSLIENANPNLLLMTYQLTLANIIPNKSAFTVTVNSATRTINSVSINGTKVNLILQSPVNYGDLVTVAYSKPAVNPLQTPSGGQAATLSATIVTNNVNPSSPELISSVVENGTPSLLSLSFSQSLANITPNISAFTVLVNTVTRTVNSININGSLVILTLAVPIVYSDQITVAYTKPGINPLQSSSGGQVSTFTSKPVTNNVGVVNNPPEIQLSYPDTCVSGFIGVIDASGSTDKNNDILSYHWAKPDQIDISSPSSSKIRFLAPIISTSETFDFTLSVSDGKAITSENFSVTVIPYKPEISQSIISNVMSSSYLDSNIPENIKDGNTETYWSADGDNQWLTCKLRDSFSIDHLKLSFSNQSMGGSFFDILASKDSLKWDPLLTNATSCGFSTNLQIFASQGSSSTAYSFVKFIGHGNSLSSLNKVSELQIYGGAVYPSGEFSVIGMNIYPNPAQNIINLFFKESVQDPQILRIANYSGNIVYESRVESGTYYLQIPITFPSGHYLVHLIANGIIKGSSKLIIQ